MYLKTSGVLLILLFGALLGWIFGFVPADAYMGFSQKIMYVHVPAIWVAYLAFFVVFVASIGYLWRRHPLADRLAAVSAELGVLFCAVGLISGAIWGRPTWGVYWVWDARLTTTLLLLLIFFGLRPAARARRAGSKTGPSSGGVSDHRLSRCAFDPSFGEVVAHVASAVEFAAQHGGWSA